MRNQRNAGGHTPKAAVRALVNRFRPSSGGDAQVRRVSGKVIVSTVVAGGALVAVGQPLMAGAGTESASVEPAAHVVSADSAVPAVPPALAAPQAPAAPVAPAVPPAPAAPAPAPEAQPAAEAAPQPVTKSVDFAYQAQQTGYWCGPTATRIALSSKTGDLPGQGALAAELGTDEDGTDHIRQVVDELNERLAPTGTQYETRDWGGRPLTPEMTDQLWSDTVRNIDAGKAMVANIVAKPGNQPPGYPSSQTIYHYVTIVGYNEADKTVHIADPARFGGIEDYWLSLDQAASLIQPKGYAA